MGSETSASSQRGSHIVLPSGQGLQAQDISDRPQDGGGDALRLQVRALLDGPQAGSRIAQLLASIEGCAVQHLGGANAAQVATAAVAVDEPRPAAVLLLCDGSQAALVLAMRRDLHSVWPEVPVFVLADEVDERNLADMVGCGICDFATLASPDAELRLRVRRMLGLLPRSADEADAGSASGETRLSSLRTRLIGSAPAFLKLVHRLPSIAGSEASVLLQGETGTGKEVFAQALHYHSPRARGPWIAVNCGAIPPELVEDELFGHVRGAYTHAMGTRSGLVREAEGGTLFLDEIDSMPLPAQAKLLRFLHDMQYRAVGASQVQTADVRVVAASNHDLHLAAGAGSFRSDLYFRLAVLCLTLPPLRDRAEDIAALALHFLADFARAAERPTLHLTPAALHALQLHTWPGNVRELKHVMQRAVLLAQGPAVQIGDIELDGSAAPEADTPASFRQAKARAVEAFERGYLENLLAQCGGNISRAARSAQKNRRAFFELMRRHDIDADRFRN